MSIMVPSVHAEEVVLDVHGLELLGLDVFVEFGPQGVVVKAVQVSKGEHNLRETVWVQVVDFCFDASDETVDITLDSVLGNDVESFGSELDWQFCQIFFHIKNSLQLFNSLLLVLR